jgi:hypothetical protein
LGFIADLRSSFPIHDVVEIGCGQGEFVQALVKLGVNAIGYDPILKQNSPNLRNQYFTPEIQEERNSNEVYVMRCVLPHIKNPWEFIDSVVNNNINARFYVEFQRLEWILEKNAWQQLSHDHVNLFSIQDFQNKYEILESGIYSEGEWACVFFQRRQVLESSCLKLPFSDHTQAFETLFETRERQISELMNLNNPLVVYGAAGKGIVFSYSMKAAGKDEIYAVDADSNRQGKYLECSGVKVYSPDTILNEVKSDAIVVVMNENHLGYARNVLRDFSKIITLANV